MIAPLTLSVLLAASPAPVSLSVDLNGGGTPETVTAVAHRGTVVIEVRNSQGKRVARARTSGPDDPTIVLNQGSLGASGAILEVSAITPTQECRTFWRLRGKELSNLPLLGDQGRLPDCVPPQGWTDSWKEPREGAPAEYLRERTRPTANGLHHRTEIYRFTGFELRFDPERSTAEIGGVAIPDWTSLSLYPRPLIDALLSCFKLSAFRTAVRLSFATDRAEGLFALVVRHGSSADHIPITAASPGKEKHEWDLTAGPSEHPILLDVQLDKAGHSPLEVNTDGFGIEHGRIYVPVSRLTAQGLEVFATANDELALQSLTGSWDNVHGERVRVDSVSINPALLEFDKQKVQVSIERAPAGADVLLVPSDGSSPKTALVLRGPNVMARQSVACAAGAEPGPDTCRLEGPVVVYRRVGAEVNTR